MIHYIVYLNKPQKVPFLIIDKINSAKASGTNEYITFTEYVLMSLSGEISTVKPYELIKVLAPSFEVPLDALATFKQRVPDFQFQK